MANDNTYLLPLLKKIATEQSYSNPDIEISPISTAGANYTSRLYHIKITSDSKDSLQLFAKIAAQGEEMREQFDPEFYENERFMYTELMKIYRGLEETCNLSEKHKLTVPKCYGADATRFKEILMLEDLSCQGYTLHNHMESVSWEYATAAVTELAKFHAQSLAFQNNDPIGFDKVANTLQHGMLTEHAENHVFYNSSVKSAVAAVREQNKNKLQRFLEGTGLSKYCSMFGALRRRPVLIHADFRPSNMMHRCRKDGSIELMVVDYQTIQAGCPVIDLLYFIFTATDGQFRAEHYQELVEYYHSELGAALARIGLDVNEEYSRQEFKYELREKLPYGLHMAVLLLPVIMIDEDDAPQLDNELNMAKPAVKVTGDHYVRRLNEIVDDYVTWGILV